MDQPPCGIPFDWPVPNFWGSFPFQRLNPNSPDCLPFSLPLLGPSPILRARTCLKPDAISFDGVPCTECAKMAEVVAQAGVIYAQDIPNVPYRLMSHMQLLNVYKAQGLEMDRLEYISFNWRRTYDVLEGRRLREEAKAALTFG